MGAETASVPLLPRPVGRQGAIVIGVAALHIILLWILLETRLAPERIAERRTEITYVPLLPIPARPPTRRNKSHFRKPAVIWPDYHWIVPLPGINVGPDAIASPRGKLRIPPPSAELLRPSCRKVLRRDSPEWKRCMAGTPSQQDDGWTEFQVPLTESQYAKRWEAEKRAREEPEEVPCTYVHSFPDSGGPQPPAAPMADIGCAAKQLFGH